MNSVYKNRDGKSMARMVLFRKQVRIIGVLWNGRLKSSPVYTGWGDRSTKLKSIMIETWVYHLISDYTKF